MLNLYHRNLITDRYIYQIGLSNSEISAFADPSKWSFILFWKDLMLSLKFDSSLTYSSFTFGEAHIPDFTVLLYRVESITF